MQSRSICRAIWITSFVALVGLLGFNFKPSSVAAPGSLKPFVTNDKVIALQVPENWQTKETGVQGISSGIKISPGGGVVFNISSDLVGSLLADIDKSTNTMATSVAPEGTAPPDPAQPGGVGSGGASQDAQPAPGASSLPGLPALPPGPKKSALQKLHDMQAKKLEEEQTDYRDGETQKAQVAGREALLTPFTFTATAGLTPMPVVGERVTIVGRDLHFSIVYRCRREDEKTILPVLRKMLDSLRLEEQGG